MVPPQVTASRCAPGRAGQRARDPVPHQAGPQLGELVARVAARPACPAPPRGPARQRGERRGPADRRARARRPPSRRARSSRRSAGPARRAGCAGTAAPRSAPAAHPLGHHGAAGPGRRGTWGRSRRGETSPTWCPARPTRCSPLATDGGDSTWMTRSTAPMSMPSSRLDVATTAGSRPALRSSSITARCSLRHRAVVGPGEHRGAPRAPRRLRHHLRPGGRRGRPRPGLGLRRRLAARSAASSFSRPHSRSASRREFANTIVDRCCSIRSSTRSSTCGQIERLGAGPLLAVFGAAARHRVQLGHVLDRDDDLQLDALGDWAAAPR